MIESAEDRAVVRANRLQVEKNKRGLKLYLLQMTAILNCIQRKTVTGCYTTFRLFRMRIYTRYNEKPITQAPVFGCSGLETMSNGGLRMILQGCAVVESVSMRPSSSAAETFLWPPKAYDSCSREWQKCPDVRRVNFLPQEPGY